MSYQDSLAEWSKALASGASPQGRGFEPHSCHLFDEVPDFAQTTLTAAVQSDIGSERLRARSQRSDFETKSEASTLRHVP